MSTETITPGITTTRHGSQPSDGGASSAAKESLEDYTLRYAPRSYRKWTCGAVAVGALGGIAYLADFAIGANIGLAHGTANGLLGILVAAVAIFVTGLPLAYYSARYNIDLDLVTRGAGFGYCGSIITNIIMGSYTVIFFATEGAIMAQGLKLGLGIPLGWGYLITSVVILPLVFYGMNALTVLQKWTTPIWLVLMLGPVIYLLVQHPESVSQFISYSGANGESVNFGSVMLAAGVCLSLIAQISEQNDYLRFMPPKTAKNRKAWWASMLLGGPGWVLFGACKQILGMFLAVYLVSNVVGGSAYANEPVRQFVFAFQQMMPPSVAMLLAVVLVVISQVKINATNAYSGSLAWTNAFTRITKTYPGRIVFVIFNVVVSLILMEANMFDFLNTILGFYSNVGIAWIFVVATDIVVNKYLLKISPKQPEFRRGMLYNWNPVGIVSLTLSAVISIAAYFGVFGAAVQPFSPIIAAAIAFVCTPLMAVITRGKYYLRRTDDGIAEPMLDEDGNPSGAKLTCHVTGMEFERPDMIASAKRGPDGELQYVSSLALATDKTGELILPADPPVAG